MTRDAFRCALAIADVAAAYAAVSDRDPPDGRQCSHLRFLAVLIAPPIDDASKEIGPRP